VGARRSDIAAQRDASHREAAQLMEIVRLTSDELFVHERSDLLRFNQNDIVRILDFAFDEQKGFLCDEEAKTFKKLWLDNCI